MEKEEFGIIVVDDEEWIRKGLVTKLAKSGLPLTPAMEAPDAESALACMNGPRPPELVVCDIRMQGMDGLQLSAAIRRTNPDAQIIIVSGFSDFEYAKRALQIGVADYLLKPVGTYELFMAVSKGIATIRSTRLNLARLGKALAMEKEKDIGTRFRSFLDGGPHDLEGLFSEYDRNGRFTCLYVYVEPREDRDTELAFDSFIDSIPGSRLGANALFYRNKSNEYSLLIHHGGTPPELAARLVEWLGEHGISGCSCGVSRPHTDLKTCLNEAILNMKHRLLADGAAVLGRETVSPFSEAFVLPSHQVETIKAGLRNGLFKNIAAALDSILADFRKGKPTYQSVENAYLQLLMLANEGNSMDIEARMACFPREPYSFGSIAAMIDFLKEVFLSVLSVSAGASESRKHAIIHSIVQNIDCNFAQHISLENLASANDLNPCYLSLLFKEVMRVNFQDYLSKVRIDNAKILLSSGEYRINQVAVKTGFMSRYYFSRAFKKSEGLTPSQFMERLGRK